MRKLRNVVTALVVIGLAASCHMGQGKRVIEVTENNFFLRIEYTGRVTFTEDSTAIKSISRNGHVKFEMNGKKLEAENQGNRIVYRLFDEEEAISTLTDHEKKFVGEAVHEMIRRGHYRN